MCIRLYEVPIGRYRLTECEEGNDDGRGRARVGIQILVSRNQLKFSDRLGGTAKETHLPVSTTSADPFSFNFCFGTLPRMHAVLTMLVDGHHQTQV